MRKIDLDGEGPLWKNKAIHWPKGPPMQIPRDKLLERFLRYVAIDTQSEEGVTDRYPSTEKQKDLLRLLVSELLELGLSDAAMDEHGYVFATLPSNLPPAEAEKIPRIGFLAHVDTSPESPGAGLKPQIWENYDGGEITLPGDTSQVIRPSETPVLARYKGYDLITSDGTTLLGADDKAGIAEIMTAIEVFLAHPELPRPTIRVGFTPDEEVGMGTAHFDIDAFGVQAAYTLDGGELGEVEDETFHAWLATFTIEGVNVHPGYAKDKLVNALRPMSAIVERLAAEASPETTDERGAYLHPYVGGGDVTKANLKVLLRGFTQADIDERKVLLQTIRDEVAAAYPGAQVSLEIVEQYKNMKVYLDADPRVTEFAIQAVEAADIKPLQRSIRGGTDGARLSEKGLPTPNIFAGGHDFHSKLEFVPVQSMMKAVEVIVHLARIWTEER
jgi:tripeptide aminopeptidase